MSGLLSSAWTFLVHLGIYSLNGGLFSLYQLWWNLDKLLTLGVVLLILLYFDPQAQHKATFTPRRYGRDGSATGRESRTAQWMTPLPQKRYSRIWKRLVRRFPFLAKLVYWGVMAVVVIAALNRLGVATTSVVAIFGAASESAPKSTDSPYTLRFLRSLYRMRSTAFRAVI